MSAMTALSGVSLSLHYTFVSLSLQIVAAVERSLKMSSLWWRWTSTGTSAASSAKCAIKCLMPNISAS